MMDYAPHSLPIWQTVTYRRWFDRLRIVTCFIPWLYTDGIKEVHIRGEFDVYLIIGIGGADPYILGNLTEKAS